MIVTVKAAAELFKLKPCTVALWVRLGRLAAHPRPDDAPRVKGHPAKWVDTAELAAVLGLPDPTAAL